eukprot:scaffold72502_cov31-Tisochrysis_lutea.AAC.6
MEKEANTLGPCLGQGVLAIKLLPCLDLRVDIHRQPSPRWKVGPFSPVSARGARGGQIIHMLRGMINWSQGP